LQNKKETSNTKGGGGSNKWRKKQRRVEKEGVRTKVVKPLIKRAVIMRLRGGQKREEGVYPMDANEVLQEKL